MELGGDEHFVARQATFAQPLADALLVAVGLGRVDVSIPDVESPADGVHTFRPVGDLPYAEPEQRDPVPVGEHTGLSIDRHPTGSATFFGLQPIAGAMSRAIVSSIAAL